MKKICFDLDGVICTNTYGDYKNAKPIQEAIEKVNKLYKDNYIIIFTARFMGIKKGDIREVYNEGFEFTKSQLKEWKVSYNELVMGKPEYDLYIDDKNYNYSSNWIAEL